MGTRTDPSVVIAESLGPLLKTAMGPHVKKSFFGKWQAGAFQIGYVQRLCEAIGEALFLNEDVGSRACFKILAEYFDLDVLNIPSLISSNQQKYAEGILLADRRFHLTMKHSDLFENLQHDVQTTMVQAAPARQRVAG
ncbi:hypothetical protein [Sandarakinorhabdus rubra]|uniref:hypothetical protein n=1 Tax=Sandarakinorhabdus rubra TaxID=2672568 RepID=UPI0013DD6AC9|nr:hypothetical protein [Sandarakinorhabdus rubra]